MQESTPQNTPAFKKQKKKKKHPFFNAEMVAFFLFLGALGFLILMSIFSDAPPKKEEVFSISTNRNPIVLDPDPDPELKVESLEKIPFPEEESDWKPLLKKHLWRVANAPQPNLVQESKLFLSEVPQETVSEYIHSLLKSETASDRVFGVIGVRFIRIKSLVSEVADLVPPIAEEKSVVGLHFYLGALSLGDKSQGTILSSYAFQSREIKNRLTAFEALAKIKVPALVPQLCELLMQQSKSTPESVAVIQTLIASIQPDQYPLISKLFDSSLSYPKESALFIMRAVDIDGFIQFYEKALLDESLAIRKRAYFCLMELKSSDSVPLLLERAKNTELSRWEQMLALETVGRCGANLKPEQLELFLLSKDTMIRFVVYSILANLKDLRGVSGLISLLSISESEIEVPQGSDMEEELSWLQEQTILVLQAVTQKEFSDAVSWNNWWLKQQQTFKFPAFSYMEKPPALYETR